MSLLYRIEFLHPVSNESVALYTNASSATKLVSRLKGLGVFVEHMRLTAPLMTAKEVEGILATLKPVSAKELTEA